MVTLDPFKTLLALINQANPNLPMPLGEDNVSLSEVNAHPTADGLVNAQAVITGIEKVGYSASANVYYRRRDLAQMFKDAQIIPALSWDGLGSWMDLFTQLNERYATQLSAVDIPAQWFPTDYVDELSFVFPAGSVFYQGTFSLTLHPSVNDKPLSEALAVTSLSGLIGPVG